MHEALQPNTGICRFCDVRGPLVRSALGTECCESCRQFQRDLLEGLLEFADQIEPPSEPKADNVIIQPHGGVN